MKKIFALLTFGFPLYASSLIAFEAVSDTMVSSDSAPFDASAPTTITPDISDRKSEDAGLLIDSLKADNYENMSLEEVQKVLMKKEELSKALENQLRTKEVRDQQKRALLDQLQRVDEENKHKLLQLKQPFKR